MILVHIINILNINSIMNKKVLKMYEAPAVELVELEVESQILAGSGTNAKGVEEDEWDDEEG